MADGFFPKIDSKRLAEAVVASDVRVLFELVVEPLHEELYRRQDFNFMDILTEGQQLALSYDYVLQQVEQGGFIQLLANGYIGLLPDMPGWLQHVGAGAMAEVIDDVIKVYVLNIDLFNREMTTQEFARLYDELKEFEMLETRFRMLHNETMTAISNYIKENLSEFAAL